MAVTEYLNEARRSLRDQRDRLVADLQQDPRWREVERLNEALKVLGDDEAVAVTVEAHIVPHNEPTTKSSRRFDPEKGTYPLAKRVLAANPEREWSAAEIAAEMQAQGWTTGARDPVNAMRTALAKLTTDGVTERMGYGAYRYKVDVPPDPEQEPRVDPRQQVERGDHDFRPVTERVGEEN